LDSNGGGRLCREAQCHEPHPGLPRSQMVHCA
jgi:hypothetical protein